MTTNLLFKNFHLLADTPGGVKKLRQLILQLAVQGRLVSQNHDDEPASVLLEKIREEKNRLIREGKIKKQKPLPEIRPEEIPFELPQGWEWTNIQSLYCQYPISNQQKIKFKNYNESGKIPIVDQGKELIGGHTNEKEKVIKIFPAIIFGDHTRITKYIDFPFVPGADGIKVLLPVIIYEKYLYHLIKSIELPTRGYARHYRLLKERIVPLPPLPEQHRIVAKVDQLMALCDELEAKQEKQKTTHARLNKSVLHTLSESRSKDELSSNWTRIKNNFNLLFTTPESIQELRSSILQLAVQGRLVSQSPDDEPAQAVLEKSKSFFEGLSVQKKMKRLKTLPPITDQDKPFTLPSGWAWSRLGELIKVTSGDGLSSKDMIEGHIPVYGGNGVAGFHNKCNIEKQTLVIGRVGYYCGSVHITPDKAWVTDNAFITYFNYQVLNIWFLKYLLNATDFRKHDNATAQPVISGAKIYPIIIGVPPLPEQHRIVAKVDQLMALSDELESRLTQFQQYGQKLMHSVVAGGRSIISCSQRI